MFLDHYLYNVLHTSFPQRPQFDKENLLVTVILTYCTCIIDTFIGPTCDSPRVKEYKLPESDCVIRENIMFLDHYLYNVLHTSFPQRPQFDKENLLVTVILTYCTCIIDTFIGPTCDSPRVKEYKLPES